MTVPTWAPSLRWPPIETLQKSGVPNLSNGPKEKSSVPNLSNGPKPSACAKLTS